MMTLEGIFRRIEAKKADYDRYNFTALQNNALKTYFDLSQEFDEIEDFYHLCVAIPKSYFGLDACLYTIDPKQNDLLLSARTEPDECELHTHPPGDVQPADHPQVTPRRSLVLTIRGKRSLIEQLPFPVSDDVLGLLEVYPADELNDHDWLFFEKYANRIGFNIHNRFLVEKNLEHLRFIRSLVADIEHNVIVPNMVYKLFLRRLRGKVTKNVEIGTRLADSLSGADDAAAPALKEMEEVNAALVTELDNIERHYRTMSLFLETLLRRSHFDEGRLTLRTKKCNMHRDVVQPQLERYIEQFSRAGIGIDDRLSGIPEEEVINVVDVGLLAQVYANLFSNAVKYTQPVEIFGEQKKYIAYGHQVVRDFFGPGRDGVKYNVFSSGPHITYEEREKIFEEEYRGTNIGSQPGTGHGLAFVKNAIEIHGGIIGYEPTDYGNNFFFILPV